MLGYNPNHISLKELFCFENVNSATLEYINPYRTNKTLTTLGSYYRFRKKTDRTGLKYIKDIDAAIDRFKAGIDDNFGVRFVSEAVVLTLKSLNLYERNFLSHLFGLDLRDKLKVLPGVDVRILNAKNNILEKLRKPTFVYSLNRVLHENKSQIFQVLSRYNAPLHCDDLDDRINSLNGGHRLAVEVCFEYYSRFLNSVYHREGDYWCIKDNRKLERVIGAITRRNVDKNIYDF